MERDYKNIIRGQIQGSGACTDWGFHEEMAGVLFDAFWNGIDGAEHAARRAINFIFRHQTLKVRLKLKELEPWQNAIRTSERGELRRDFRKMKRIRGRDYR